MSEEVTIDRLAIRDEQTPALMAVRFLNAMRYSPLVPPPEMRKPGWFVKAMAKAGYRIAFGPVGYLNYRIWCWQDERQARVENHTMIMEPRYDGGEIAQVVEEVRGHALNCPGCDHQFDTSEVEWRGKLVHDKRDRPSYPYELKDHRGRVWRIYYECQEPRPYRRRSSKTLEMGLCGERTELWKVKSMIDEEDHKSGCPGPDLCASGLQFRILPVPDLD